ncbi:retrovirus-related pol polyprotein from transposon TNT 1-94 [Tanacetum coccineum]
MSQAKEAQIKLYKTREDKELDKVIALENKVKVLNDIVYKTGQSVQTMNMLNRNCKTSFAKPEFLKKAQRANPRLYDIGCYNDNLALMLTPDSDETIRLDKERRSKLSDLIRPFDYAQLNNLYDWFVPQREKSAVQHNFPKTSTMSQTSTNNEFSKESFRKQPTLLEKRIDESIPWDKKCQSSKELFKIKKCVGTIFDGVERCKPNNRQKNIFKDFTCVLKEELGCLDLKYVNSLEDEVDNLKSQMETQKTQFLNEIDRLSREYYYADHMNAILGIYTDLDEFTDLQCDYGETLEKCERLEKELSKSKTNCQRYFESLQKHAINLDLIVQHTITIKRVYYVEGLNHNLFSVGQFCDADLEVAFRKSTCYIRDLKGNDLLTGSRGTDLYSISLQDSTSPNPICLMAKATSSQAWLWHRRLSHLNFDTINLLSKNNIVNGLPKLKFVKDHLCSSCELGKAKRKSFHTKTPQLKNTVTTSYTRDLCGPKRVESRTSSRPVDSSNHHTFYQHHPSAQHWTKDHPLEQVLRNPSQSIRTRRQLETDGEMEELQQFDRLDVWE